MNPILLAAAMKLQAKMKELKETGVEVTSQNIDEFLRHETNGKFGLADYRAMQTPTADNFLRSVAYGLTMNQLDNILGLFDKRAADESRVRHEAFAERHPLHDAGGALLGALGTGKGLDAAGAKLLGEVHTIPDALKAGALAGGTYGAIDAAGRADDASMMDKAKMALGGGLAGATVGGVLGGTFAAGARAVQPRASAINRITAAISKEGGYDKVMERLSEFQKAGRGDEVTLADLGPHLRKALDFSANASDNVLVPTAQLLEARTAERAARLLADARYGFTAAGMPEPDYQLHKAELSDNTAAVGNRVYGALRDQHPEFDVSKLPLDKPKIAGLWKEARLAGNIAGKGPIDDLIAKLTAANPGAPADALAAAAKQVGGDAAAAERPVSLDDMLQLRRGLKGQADAAYRSGNGALGKALTDIRTHVDNAMEAGMPGVKAANAEYFGANELERVHDAGHDWWMKADKRELARVVDSIKDKPGQLDEFRRGIASGLVEKLQSTASNRDAARELTQASTDLDAKLRIVFGDEATFQTFMRRVKAEREMGKLAQTVSGSETARRMEAKGYTPEELGLDAMMQGPGTLARIGTGFAKAAMRQRSANAMGPILLTQGAPNVSKMLGALAHTPDLYGGAEVPLPSLGGRLRFDELLRSGAPAGLMSLLANFNADGQ